MILSSANNDKLLALDNRQKLEIRCAIVSTPVHIQSLRECFSSTQMLDKLLTTVAASHHYRLRFVTANGNLLQKPISDVNERICDKAVRDQRECAAEHRAVIVNLHYSYRFSKSAPPYCVLIVYSKRSVPSGLFHSSEKQHHKM